MGSQESRPIKHDAFAGSKTMQQSLEWVRNGLAGCGRTPSWRKRLFPFALRGLLVPPPPSSIEAPHGLWLTMLQVA